MFTICWSAKGGVGTSVVAAALALIHGGQDPAGAWLVDLAGDQPAVLGAPPPDGLGIADWLTAESLPGRRALLDLARPCGADVSLLPLGSAELPDSRHPRWTALAQHLSDLAQPVVVDAGHHPPPAAMIAEASASLLVTRPCYLALRRCVPVAASASGVVLVDEPGRALRAADVAASLGLPIVATVELDPSVARAIDAGLLVGRLPRQLSRSFAVAS
ncbi:MAG: hypothetical protein R2715_15655 [Ilumatobacteraceae bacterium]